MLDQIVGLIKNTTIATFGLIVGLFGVDNANILDSNTANLQGDQGQSINLSGFAQANISEALNTADENTDPILQDDFYSVGPKNTVEYFAKENLPTAVFSRPNSKSKLPKEETVISENIELISEDIEVEKSETVSPVEILEVKKEIDVTKILNTNFDQFNTQLQITEVTEDDNNYYVSYQYKTLAIENYSWKEVVKEKTLNVAKDILKKKDLETYLSEELTEVTDAEIAYLKKVQEIQLSQENISRTIAKNLVPLIGSIVNLENSSVVTEILPTEIPVETTEEIPAEDNLTSTGVIDNQAPVIVLQGNNPALIQVGSSYNDMGAKVTDNINEGLGFVVGGDIVDTDIKGSYFVTYTAMDEAGNIATSTREVIVYEYGTNTEEIIPTTVEDTPIIEDTPETPEVPVISDPEPELEPEPEPELEPEMEPEPELEVVVEAKEEKPKKDKKEEVSSEEIVAELTEEVVDEEVVSEPIEEVASEEVISESIEEVTDEEISSGITDAVVETVGEVVDSVVDTADAVIETTSETLDATVEAISDIAEEVTAMILSINIKELLTGNISSTGEGNWLINSFDTVGGTVYSNINKLINFVGGISR